MKARSRSTGPRRSLNTWWTTTLCCCWTSLFHLMAAVHGWSPMASTSTIQRRRTINNHVILFQAKRPLSTSEQERRDEDRRRIERKDDVIIGQTSAKRNAQDFALNVAATEQAYLSQASTVEQAIFQYTEQGMHHLKLLQLDEANQAFQKVFQLKPQAYLWQAGIVLYYLQDYQHAAHILVNAITFFEARFGQPATEERIWRAAAQLKLISSIPSASERKRVTRALHDDKDSNPNDIIPQIPPRTVFFEEDQTETQFLATEMRKVLRIARELFDASIAQDSVAVILARAKLRAITGPYQDWKDVTNTSNNNNNSPNNTNKPFVLDRKMWKLSAWFYLGLHYDALGIDDEAKRCMTMALAMCNPNTAADIVHTLPLLHMSRREWFDDDDDDDDMEEDEEEESIQLKANDPDNDDTNIQSSATNAPSSAPAPSSTTNTGDNISPIVLETIQEGIWELTVAELRRALQVKGLKPRAAAKEELRQKLLESLLEEIA